MEADNRLPGDAQHSEKNDDPGPSGAPWRRILWAQQPFADNYVPPEFLKGLQTQPLNPLPDLTSLVLWSLSLSQYFCITVSFVGLFLHLRDQRISAEGLATCSALSIMLCGLTMPRTGTPQTTVSDRDGAEKARSAQSSPATQPSDRQRRRKVLALSLPYALLGLVILALSPLLKTLTQATTSDSIAALSTTLFALSFCLADFSAGVSDGSGDIVITTVEKLHDGQQAVHSRRRRRSSASKPLTSGSDPAVEPDQPRLPATLSLNAALCASIVLASRLRSPIDVFSLVLAAICLFGFLPRWLKAHLALHPSQHVGTGHVGSRRAFLSVALTVLLLSVSTTLLLPFSATAALANVVACGFLSLACPLWMRKAQGWKKVRRGQWDIGVPRLRSRALR